MQKKSFLTVCPTTVSLTTKFKNMYCEENCFLKIVCKEQYFIVEMELEIHVQRKGLTFILGEFVMHTSWWFSTGV